MALAFCTIAAPKTADAQNPAFADFEEALDFARNSFVFGDYDRVLSVLEPQLYPRPPIADTEDLIAAYTFLGASAFFENQAAMTNQAFLDLLRLEPDRSLDPFVFPAEVIAELDRVRDENAEELARIARGDQSSADTVYIESRVREVPLAVAILPFGYGLFANGEDGWGAAYLTVESLLLTASITTWAINLSERVPSDTFDRDFGYLDPDAARVRRRVQISTGAAFLGVVIANMIHGAMTREVDGDVEFRTLEEAPIQLRDPETRARRWRLQLAPVIAPRR